MKTIGPKKDTRSNRKLENKSTIENDRKPTFGNRKTKRENQKAENENHKS